MDIFCEYIVKRNRNGKDYAKIAGIIILAILLSLIFIAFLGSLSFIFICGVCFGAYKLITFTDVEYEYIVTSTVLDVDRILARSSRKRLLSINLTEIDACRPIEDMPEAGDRKITDATPNGIEDGVYGIDFSKNSVRTRLLFKPNPKVITNIKKASPSLVTVRPSDIEA